MHRDGILAERDLLSNDFDVLDTPRRNDRVYLIDLTRLADLVFGNDNKIFRSEIDNASALLVPLFLRE